MRAHPFAVALVAVLAVSDVAAEAPEGEPAETEPSRGGFAIGVTLGPALLVGRGDSESVAGAGAGFGLRLGTSATPRLLWFLEFEVALYNTDSEDDLISTSQSTLTLGGHYYVREAFWLDAGVGLAGFGRRQLSGNTSTELETDGGLALRAGGGYDMLRSGIFVLSVEAGLTAGFYGGNGSLAGIILRLGGSWY